jgi:hypothetical protein
MLKKGARTGLRFFFFDLVSIQRLKTERNRERCNLVNLHGALENCLEPKSIFSAREGCSTRVFADFLFFWDNIGDEVPPEGKNSTNVTCIDFTLASQKKFTILFF